LTRGRRPGGRERFVMVCDEDPSRRVTMDYTFSEVVENELLVDFTEEGIPGTEEVVRMTSRLEFHELEGGKTRLELRAGPFREGTSDVRGGWESSFTKLDALLKAACGDAAQHERLSEPRVLGHADQDLRPRQG
jgi:uncharacterized protein YndB with AHSA1/START domain